MLLLGFVYWDVVYWNINVYWDSNIEWKYACYDVILLIDMRCKSIRMKYKNIGMRCKNVGMRSKSVLLWDVRIFIEINMSQ